ncbi:hypothetical protein AA3271_1716 [Gluconobacter japonicus NBRC 3271]|nr:hypothetical protein AA3271_1716 [Gluconobacter japonicus NBRC 3271]
MTFWLAAAMRLTQQLQQLLLSVSHSRPAPPLAAVGPALFPARIPPRKVSVFFLSLAQVLAETDQPLRPPCCAASI